MNHSLNESGQQFEGNNFSQDYKQGQQSQKYSNVLNNDQSQNQSEYKGVSNQIFMDQSQPARLIISSPVMFQNATQQYSQIHPQQRMNSQGQSMRLQGVLDKRGSQIVRYPHQQLNRPKIQSFDSKNLLISSQPVYYPQRIPSEEKKKVSQFQKYNQNTQIQTIPLSHQDPFSKQHIKPLERTVTSQVQSKIVHNIPIQFNYHSTNQQYQIQSIPTHQQIQINHQIVPYHHQNNQIKVRSTTIWEMKFIQIYQRFIWFSERHQIFRKQISYLNEQLDMVNSEEEWIELKRRHGELVERFSQVEGQIRQIIRSNRGIVQKIQSSINDNSENQNIQASKRFEELLNSFRYLQEDYNKLRQKNQAIQQLQQKHFHLNQQYTNLSNEYNKVCNMLQRKEKQSIDQQGGDGKKNQEYQNHIYDLQHYIQQLEKQNIFLQSENMKRQSGKEQNSQYQRLIENIKEKDVELNQLKMSYHQISSRYQDINQLKNQELQALKRQLKRQQIQHKDQLENQIKQLQKQIKNSVINLQKKIKQLEEEVRKKNYQKEQIKHSYQSQINSLNQELDRKNNQSEKIFKELEQKISWLQEQVRKKANEKDSNMKILNQRIAELQDELTRRNFEIIRPLSDKNIKLQEEINQKSIQISKYRQGNQYLRHEAELRRLNEIIDKKNQQILKIKKQKDRLHDQYEELHRQYENMMNDANRKKMEYNTLKRQVTEIVAFQQEIKNLNDILQKKNQQLFQLKTIAMESDNLKAQLNACFNTIQRLNDNLKTKNNQAMNFKQTIIMLEENLKQAYQTSTKQFAKSPKELNQQIQYLKDTLKRKDQQSLKIRQTIQLKDTNIGELQNQRDKIKGKYAILQRAFEEQRQQSKKRINNLERQFQNKKKHYNELQNQMRTGTQSQISSVRNQMKIKLDTIFQLETKEKDLSNRLNIVERQRKSIEIQLENALKKLKENDNSNKGLTNKIQVFRQELQKKQSIILQLQNRESSLKEELKIIKTKLVQTQGLLNHKEIELKNLEKGPKSINEPKKLNKGEYQIERYLQQIQKNQNQVTFLNQTIKNLQNKIYNMLQQKISQPITKDFTGNQIFQQKIIYTLKTENQRLRQELGYKTDLKEGVIKKQKQSRRQSPKKKEKAKMYIQNQNEEITYIQKRLFDFNNKLQELMIQNRQTQIVGNQTADPGIKIQNKDIAKIINSFKNDKQLLLHKHSNEINLFKIRIQQLQRYCNLLEGKVKNQKTYTMTKKPSKNLFDLENVYLDQLSFYKQKNKQLQQRVDKHISVNNQLKQRLQIIMKSGGNVSSLIFFKQQVGTLQSNIQSLNIKIKKLNDQNKRLKNQNNDFNKSQRDQLSTFQNQNIIQQFKRKISQLMAEKSMLQNQKNNLLMEMNSLNSQIFNMKNKDYQTLNKIQNYQQRLKNQQSQLLRATNKIKIQEAQIDRLNENIQKKESNYADIISENPKLKAKINQLQSLVNRYQKQIQNKIIQTDQYRKQLEKASFNVANTKQNNDNSLRQIIRNLELDNDKLVDELNLKISQNAQKDKLLQELKTVIKNLRYKLEFLRSNYIEIDQIFKEFRMRSNDQQILPQRFKANVERGLKTCEEISGLINIK